jgi:hypothetical protein
MISHVIVYVFTCERYRIGDGAFVNYSVHTTRFSSCTSHTYSGLAL